MGEPGFKLGHLSRSSGFSDALFCDCSLCVVGGGGGRCHPNTDGLGSDDNKIILFWMWEPHMLTGQVAASCFHYVNMAVPLHLLIDKVLLPFLCVSSATAAKFQAHCSKDNT